MVKKKFASADTQSNNFFWPKLCYLTSCQDEYEKVE